jgi:hypothetical protein
MSVKMRKPVLIIGVILVFSTVSVAQTKNDTIKQLQNQIVNLEQLNLKLSNQLNVTNSNIKKVEGKLSSTADSIEVLKKELVLTNTNLQAIADNFESQLRQFSDKTNSEFAVLSERIANNTQYWILVIVLIVLISTILIFWSRSRLTILKTELTNQIKSSSDGIREEIIKLDNQVFWSLDFQKKLYKTEQTESENIDHSLALKVADEIIRIQKNLSTMDPGTKGLKQLEFAVERIQDNFTENGYEMVELLNKPYDQGMKVSAKFKPDATLKRGEQKITRIIKPQVNYNNIIIQEAQVEVSIGV